MNDWRWHGEEARQRTKIEQSAERSRQQLGALTHRDQSSKGEATAHGWGLDNTAVLEHFLRGPH